MYEKELKIKDSHSLKQIKTEWKTKGNEDFDITSYEELNEEGVVICKYIVKDTTLKTPPFSRFLECQKLDLNDKLIEEKRISM